MRSEVGSYTSLNSTVLHSMTTTPVAAILLGGSTAATTNSAYTPFSMFFSTGSSSGGAGIAWNAVGFAATAHVFSAQTSAFQVPATTASTLFGTSAMVSQFTTASFVSSGTGVNAPIIYGLLGGGDIQAHVTTVDLSTSVTTGTITSTGWGFQPNVVLALFRTTGSSQDAWSFTVGATGANGTTLRGWVIAQTLREGAAINANKLTDFDPEVIGMTTAGIDIFLTSPITVSDGVQMPYTVRDVTRPGSLVLMGLNAPAVYQGFTTISQNTLTVSGLSALVNTVIVGSIGSSIRALAGEANNHFSIGIASSNGKQGSISGFNKDGAAPAGGQQSAMSTVNILQFLSTAGVISQGTFALTVDGFTITFNNTAASGWYVNWLAISNKFADVSANVLSSAALTANLTSVQGMASNILSSASLTANLTQVGMLSANIQSSVAISAFLSRDFDPGRSNASAIADLILRIHQGEERHVFKTHSTDSPAQQRTMTVTNTPQRIGVGPSGNTKVLGILPPTTNTLAFRLAAGKTSNGFKVSPNGLSVFTLSTGSLQDVFLSCTVTSASIPVRVLLR